MCKSLASGSEKPLGEAVASALRLEDELVITTKLCSIFTDMDSTVPPQHRDGLEITLPIFL